MPALIDAVIERFVIPVNLFHLRLHFQHWRLRIAFYHHATQTIQPRALQSLIYHVQISNGHIAYMQAPLACPDGIGVLHILRLRL